MVKGGADVHWEDKERGVHVPGSSEGKRVRFSAKIGTSPTRYLQFLVVGEGTSVLYTEVHFTKMFSVFRGTGDDYKEVVLVKGERSSVFRAFI